MLRRTLPTLLSTTAESDDPLEEEDEEEDTPEALYNRGEIGVNEYYDIKATHRVDALYHTVEEVTGVNYTCPELNPKTKPLKTIGFIQ